MSVGNAIKFIKKTDSDSSFRKSLYKLNGIKEFKDFLNLQNLEFSDFDFEEAFNHMHSQCQFSEGADKLYNLKNLFQLIITNSK